MPLFPTTRWTLVLSAREGEAARRAALDELMTRYWRPVYLYLRSRGLPREAAEDAVQGLFAQLLERDFPARADPMKGRFRTYLKACADHYLAHQHEREVALKRGGTQRPVPLDALDAERDLAGEPALGAEFDRAWARDVMGRALGRLRDEYARGERKSGGEAVLRFFDPEQELSYAEASEACGLTTAQFKAALHRARRRYRELLREEVAETLADAAGAEDEIRVLLQAVAT
jgi:RNA polymerase sigma-70 factor (ECF subfamily)